MFKKILIANRGEIACRVAATARRLGIATVAVYSDVDANARHVLQCDEAVVIGTASPKDSYLRSDRIIAAAKASGAEAIHPGYGFLSENEGFAAACVAAGLVFIGPPATAIAAMGSKSAAKALMGAAGVPLVPGYHGDRQEAAFLREQADAIGYPVLIKASAGGGGKGMRRVDRRDDFDAALASCQREASASFGDQRVLIERYVNRPRHIEIQIFADQQGNTVSLFERDCSVQRRHQKVLEEAPAPGIDRERRAAMGAAAVAAARAVGYVGAGTVEFIAEPVAEAGSTSETGLRFYFMEMNTRLQVEHPVTEAITGLDLVEWQLRIACGEPLPLRQDQLEIKGHAIEARICAENPDADFRPATGTLDVVRWPPHVAFCRNAAADGSRPPASVRIDAGIAEGDVVTPHYDPMLAKLIVWGADRAEALAHMAAALAATRIVGVQTNVAFLRRVVMSRSFELPDLDTALIEREHAALFDAAGLPFEIAAAGVMAHQLQATKARETRDPWSRADGWQALGRAPRRAMLRIDATATATDAASAHSSSSASKGEPVALEGSADGTQWLVVRGNRQSFAASTLGDHRHDIVLNGSRLTLDVFAIGTAFHVFAAGASTVVHDTSALPQHNSETQDGPSGRLTAPMPGKVVSFLVKTGETVTARQPWP